MPTSRRGASRGSLRRLPRPAEEADLPRRRLGDIDRLVGSRIRARRILLGMTQQQIAGQLGITYQQVHKYERAVNTVSAGRLYQIAEILKIPVDRLFDEVGRESDRKLCARERVCLELARNFAQIGNRGHQEAVSQLARALAAPVLDQRRQRAPRSHAPTMTPRHLSVAFLDANFAETE